MAFTVQAALASRPVSGLNGKKPNTFFLPIIQINTARGILLGFWY